MISPSQDALFILLRSFILSLISCEVVQGLGNGVPMPAGAFIAITATAQERLSTNVSTVDTVTGSRTVMQPTMFDIQVDCYGPDSADWAATISMMWRDPYGCDMLDPTADPLYTSDPKQAPLISGEENYVQRWTLSALLQYNPTITLTQQSADTLAATVVNVDATYHP